MLAALAMLVITTSADSENAEETIAWPTESWRMRALDEAARSRPAFQELERYLFPPDFDERARRGVRTDGIVVIQGAIWSTSAMAAATRPKWRTRPGR